MDRKMKSKIKYAGQEIHEIGRKPSAEFIAQTVAVAKVKGDSSAAATVSDTEGKWFAVQANDNRVTQASLAGRRFGTDNQLPGYLLVQSKDIARDAPKITDNPGAVGILTRAGEGDDREYAEISAEQITNIKSPGDLKATAEVLPFPRNRRGGKRVKARKKAAWRRLRVYGTADKQKAAR